MVSNLIYHLKNSFEYESLNGNKKWLKIKLNSSLITKIIIYSFCTVGCIFFLCHTLINYMKYKTKIQTESLDENIIPYNVSICLSIESLFYDGKIMPNDQYYRFKSSLFNRTIEDLFNQSPSSRAIMSGCGYRGIEIKNSSDQSNVNFKDAIMYLENDESLCSSIFTIEKYILKSYACYKFARNNFKRNNNFIVKLNDENDQLVIAVKKDQLTKHFLFSVHEYYPFLSSYWSSAITKKHHNTWYSVSYIRYDMEILPPPYTKDGFDDLFFNQCFDTCMKNKLSTMNKSLASIFTTPEMVRLVTADDRRNSSFLQMIKKFTQVCRERCEKIPFVSDATISYTFLVTDLREEPTTTDGFMNHSTTFYLKKSDYPVISVKFRADMSFFELIINIGSILSIWFGISPMSSSCLQNLTSGPELSMSTINLMWENLNSIEQRTITWHRNNRNVQS